MLKVLLRKYSYRNPMYLVMGDFNYDLESWKEQSITSLVGWDVYPTDRCSTRDLRLRPIDYVLVYAPANISVTDNGTGPFCPLPLRIGGAEDERSYRLSTKEGHHQNNGAVFTTRDLKSKNLTNSAPLYRTVH